METDMQARPTTVISNDACNDNDASVTGEQLYRLGLAYAAGSDREQDLVAAHKWFNLAVMKGFSEARTCRQEMADLLDKDSIQLALKAARAWLDLKPANDM